MIPDVWLMPQNFPFSGRLSEWTYFMRMLFMVYSDYSHWVLGHEFSGYCFFLSSRTQKLFSRKIPRRDLKRSGGDTLDLRPGIYFRLQYIRGKIKSQSQTSFVQQLTRGQFLMNASQLMIILLSFSALWPLHILGALGNVRRLFNLSRSLRCCWHYITQGTSLQRTVVCLENDNTNHLGPFRSTLGCVCLETYVAMASPHPVLCHEKAGGQGRKMADLRSGIAFLYDVI